MVDANPSNRRCTARVAGPCAALRGPARCCSTRLGSALHCTARTARPGVARPGVTRLGLALHGSALHGPALHSTVRVARIGDARSRHCPDAAQPAPHPSDLPCVAWHGLELQDPARIGAAPDCPAPRCAARPGSTRSALHGSVRPARLCDRPLPDPAQPGAVWHGLEPSGSELASPRGVVLSGPALRCPALHGPTQPALHGSALQGAGAAPSGTERRGTLQIPAALDTSCGDGRRQPLVSVLHGSRCRPCAARPARCCSTRLGSALHRMARRSTARAARRRLDRSCPEPFGTALPGNSLRGPACTTRPGPALHCTARAARRRSARRYLAWPRADCPAPRSTARPALYGSALLARCRTVRRCKARSLPLDGSALHGARRSARRCRPGITRVGLGSHGSALHDQAARPALHSMSRVVRLGTVRPRRSAVRR
ncbi:hypothetical protein APR09_003039 [Nocardia amikacinitolerans]|nr:hypothetical protein [Nocardia amikacinitolerans]